MGGIQSHFAHVPFPYPTRANGTMGPPFTANPGASAPLRHMPILPGVVVDMNGVPIMNGTASAAGAQTAAVNGSK